MGWKGWGIIPFLPSLPPLPPRRRGSLGQRIQSLCCARRLKRRAVTPRGRRSRLRRLCTASGRLARGTRGQTDIPSSFHSPSRALWNEVVSTQREHKGHSSGRSSRCPHGQNRDPCYSPNLCSAAILCLALCWVTTTVLGPALRSLPALQQSSRPEGQGCDDRNTGRVTRAGVGYA